MGQLLSSGGRRLDLLNDSNRAHEQYCNALTFLDDETLVTYRLRSRDANGYVGKGAWVKIWKLKRENEMYVTSTSDKIVLSESDATGVYDLRIDSKKQICCLAELWSKSHKLVGAFNFNERGDLVFKTEKIRKENVVGGYAKHELAWTTMTDLFKIVSLTMEDMSLSGGRFQAEIALFDYSRNQSKKNVTNLTSHVIKRDMFALQVGSIQLSPCGQVFAVAFTSKNCNKIFSLPPRGVMSWKARVMVVSSLKPNNVLCEISSGKFTKRNVKLRTESSVVVKFGLGGRVLLTTVLGSNKVEAYNFRAKLWNREFESSTNRHFENTTIDSICVSTNGRVMCTSHFEERKLRLTCIVSGTVFRTISTISKPWACCFSPLSDHVAYANDQFTCSILPLLQQKRAKGTNLLERKPMPMLRPRNEIALYLIITMNKRRNMGMSTLIHMKSFYRVMMFLSRGEEFFRGKGSYICPRTGRRNYKSFWGDS